MRLAVVAVLGFMACADEGAGAPASCQVCRWRAGRSSACRQEGSACCCTDPHFPTEVNCWLYRVCPTPEATGAYSQETCYDVFPSPDEDGTFRCEISDTGYACMKDGASCP